jgi:hypothetical protein
MSLPIVFIIYLTNLTNGITTSWIYLTNLTNEITTSWIYLTKSNQIFKKNRNKPL